MTQKKNFETVGGIIGFDRGDKPHAVVFAKNIFVNTEPRIKEFNNGNKVIEFLTTIQGDYSKDALEKVAKGQVEKDEFGVSVSLTVDVTNPNSERYFSEILVKGARIESCMVDFTINQGRDGRSFLNGSIRGVGKVIQPEGSVMIPQQPKVEVDSDELGF